MAEEKTAKTTKIKKKKWIQIISPALFRNELIGEIPTSEPKSLIGRTVTLNLMNLTRDIKKQNVNIKFVITSIKGDKTTAEFYGYYLNPNSIKRLVRRGQEKIELSHSFKTSDNKQIRIKPLIIPYTKVSGSVAAAYRKNSIDYLTSYAAKTTFENIIKDLIINKLQKDLKAMLKKVYPIRILEISKLYIEKEKKPSETIERVEETKEDEPEQKEEPESKEPQEKPKEETEEPEEEIKEEPQE